MLILALVLSAICVVVAAIHLLWALGRWFPLGDERRMVAAVVGFREATRMPGPIPCSLVVVALLFAASAPWWGDGMVRQVILWASAAVFGARGVLAYTRWWRWLTPQEPFASNDRRYYGPMCLLLSAGYLVLAMN
ncbi:DUF3995 domain-containing protein [Loktanella sp. IMCC34160]|uniref:DUF3995 domain-containing protein n=1 Tax=Loktanella sp. IMCC34160 TaxID=2510646 RepID=UPI0013EA47A4|nr:DUF3995 domain-containing protein [Loktanella sp. IMCC34160]